MYQSHNHGAKTSTFNIAFLHHKPLISETIDRVSCWNGWNYEVQSALFRDFFLGKAKSSISRTKEKSYKLCAEQALIIRIHTSKHQGPLSICLAPLSTLPSIPFSANSNPHCMVRRTPLSPIASFDGACTRERTLLHKIVCVEPLSMRKHAFKYSPFVLLANTQKEIVKTFLAIVLQEPWELGYLNSESILRIDFLIQ